MNAPVAVELDKPRSLLFSMGAAMRVKRSAGKDPSAWSLQQFCEALDDVELFPVVFWACLAHEDKTLTVEGVADLFSGAAMVGPAKMAAVRSFLRFHGHTDEQIDALFEQAGKQADEAKGEELPADPSKPQE